MPFLLILFVFNGEFNGADTVLRNAHLLMTSSAALLGFYLVLTLFSIRRRCARSRVRTITKWNNPMLLHFGKKKEDKNKTKEQPFINATEREMSTRHYGARSTVPNDRGNLKKKKEK